MREQGNGSDEIRSVVTSSDGPPVSAPGEAEVFAALGTLTGRVPVLVDAETRTLVAETAAAALRGLVAQVVAERDVSVAQRARLVAEGAADRAVRDAFRQALVRVRDRMEATPAEVSAVDLDWLARETGDVTQGQIIAHAALADETEVAW